MKHSGRVVAVAIVAIVLAACSSDAQLGSEGDSGIFDQDGDISMAGDGSSPAHDGGAAADSGKKDGGISATDAGGDAEHDAGPPAATCSDKIQNQDETDVDCGGTHCGKCADTKKCAGGTDCTSGTCIAGFCGEASCTDGALDGTETDLDCGGASCPPCADTKICKVASDCVSDVCDHGALTCTAASCTDGVMNEGETAIDCGGANCSPCADGKTCKANPDCADGVCNVTCRAPSCTDGVMNEGETAIDCGGPSCGPCADGKTCVANTDCIDGVCAGTCQAPTCTDGIQNEGETDVDCGGVHCGPCADGLKCKVGTDCIDQACGGGTCTAPSCTDGAKNGAETDIDCGGGTCPRCDGAKSCTTGSDCVYDVCGAGNTCATSAVSCGGGGNGKATCGAAGNEDCCQTLAVPGGKIGTGATSWSVSPYRLDKYEITVGRMRGFLAAYGYDLRDNPPAEGAGAHAKIPGSGWQSVWNDRLPTDHANVTKRAGIVGGNATQDSGTSGCYGGEDASTWSDVASVNDQKAANCFDWYTLFAFCQWDGGYLPTEREWQYAAQGGTDNRTFAFGTPPAVPKATDWLPRCGNTGDAACGNPNTYMSTAYSSNDGYPGAQTVDTTYPTFLQAPGLYVVHGFCTDADNRFCFSYSGGNANSGIGAANAAHVAPPGQKLDIGKYGQSDMSGNLIEWTLDNSVNLSAAGHQQTEAACVGTDCANVDYVNYNDTNLDPTGTAIVGDRSVPGVPSYWRNYGYDGTGSSGPHDLDATYQQDGGRVMRGGSWEIAHPVNVSNRYGDYPVYRSYYASGARCARPN